MRDIETKFDGMKVNNLFEGKTSVEFIIYAILPREVNDMVEFDGFKIFCSKKKVF